MSKVRVVIFHDNFAQMGGAERVTEVLHQTFDKAELRSTLAVKQRLSLYLQSHEIRTTWMQALPFKAKLFRYYFLLYPLAIECVNLKECDVVITSCFGYAKGVRCRGSAIHICYCHNPMRWIWRTEDYIRNESLSPWKVWLLRLLLKPLKIWEAKAATRPDYYIANSQAVALRLWNAFGVSSVVIPPPIETSRFHIAAEVDNYFLLLSRLVPYKRLDLAVEACTRLGLPLLVIGDGPDKTRLRSLAGPTVRFMGRLPDEDVVLYASRCRALIVPGEEDFGITPLEINAAGRPVIAFRGGGATETIVERLNGVFFDEVSVDSLEKAILWFETLSWNPQHIRNHALGFDSAIFKKRIREFISECIGIDEPL